MTKVSSDAWIRASWHPSSSACAHVAAGDLNAALVVCGGARPTSGRVTPRSSPRWRSTTQSSRACRICWPSTTRCWKLAIYDFDGSEAHSCVAFADLGGTHQVVVSGLHWVDIMNATVNKGVALRNLQAALGVTRRPPPSATT
ncbi:MAG: hypothetical protein R2692_07910 [Microbacterium sp.]